MLICLYSVYGIYCYALCYKRADRAADFWLGRAAGSFHVKNAAQCYLWTPCLHMQWRLSRFIATVIMYWFINTQWRTRVFLRILSCNVRRSGFRVTRSELSLNLLVFKLLKPKLVKITFKNSVRTAKKTPHFTVAKINRLTLFKEIIADCCKNRTEHINTKTKV
jgi:hypothetical protein